ncbi:NAD-dependent epimerase/dehydratase family protein [Rugamonas sp. FT29W]|uniref:NAD-dependent epimerase/dehydratase family protein n=2 Tax=Rugamonas aquatica TaxID=2743357 RepID=A0A6A7NBF2_9BURK|nr:NAD-dependent epimerase/dehydratase family protein [Rugamonas aquatica]
MRHPIETADMAAIVATPGIDWSRLAGQTVCITGASGFLPSYMVETMLYLNETRQLGIRVLAMVRNRAGFERRYAHHAGRADLVCIEQDISKPFTLDERPDYIIHAASQASPKYYATDPVGTLSANTLGTAALLELARASGSKGFLYFSSSEVYGAASKVPTAEQDYGIVDPTSVRACYAESKRMGENMCVSWSHQYGMPVKIVRPFHTYGPRMLLDDGRVYADFVACILRNEPIALKSDGLATRSFCYSADAVAGFWKVLLDGAAGQAYNIGNPDGEISMRALGQLLVGMYPEKGLSVSYVERPQGDNYLASAVQRGAPDIAKANALGWRPATSLADGFRRTIESYL